MDILDHKILKFLSLGLGAVPYEPADRERLERLAVLGYVINIQPKAVRREDQPPSIYKITPLGQKALKS